MVHNRTVQKGFMTVPNQGHHMPNMVTLSPSLRDLRKPRIDGSFHFDL